VLEIGADIEKVKQHLRDDQNLKEIQDLLSQHDSLKTYEKGRVERIQQVLKGYSLYRGDGAFFYEGRICSEPVSIVRLMFIPPLKEWFPGALSDARFAARQFLRFWTHNEDRYRQYRGESLASDAGKLESALIKKLTAWLEDIALVVNGYVVHQLCSESLRRFEAGITLKPEDEIWVGSFRSLAVNKVEYNKATD
jgi:hypothetical protein